MMTSRFLLSRNASYLASRTTTSFVRQSAAFTSLTSHLNNNKNNVSTSFPAIRVAGRHVAPQWTMKSSLSFSTEAIEIPPPPTSNHAHTSLPGAKGAIIYTETDEAPALATFCLLPAITKFAALAEVDVVPCDISVAGRVLAAFPEYLKPNQREPDNLSYLGEMCLTPEANIVKLPNVSASIPQLKECIKELREKGYNVPMYPDEPSDDEERNVAERYSKVLGSAVNPVLREGNSDRRVSPPVKAFAQKNPHKMMKMWSRASRTHVAHMSGGDFYESEKSAIMSADTDVAIEFVGEDGGVKVMKESVPLLAGEVIDAGFMDVEQLRKFYEQEISEAKETETLFSLHLKATMMKISDPIMFGHCVEVFFKDAFQKHGKLFEEIGANPNNGLGAIYEAVKSKLPAEQAADVIKDIEACYENRPWLAMVNSHKGITNLHVPSDVIIDASMPVVVRDGGCMWNKLDELEDVKCVIPDRSYATTYQEIINYVKTKGQFDVATMGNVANVGLMAKKAEEYGSHDKTFEVPERGTMRVKDKNSGEIYFEHDVSSGDIWRMCQTKDDAIKDWVKLAVNRTKASGARTIFWLDENRAHDASLISKVNTYLKDYDTDGLDISIKTPADACRITCKRCTDGLDTISVTGNVLRDYLTDLFPILELGTSAKMLSIVPLLNGGGLYETGAGGSAPKHVQQFVQEGHLRWDSLGEYLATAEAFVHLGKTTGNDKAIMLGNCLMDAVGKILNNRKSPSRRVNEIDNRATSFYVTLYWAEFLAKQDPAYVPVFEELTAKRATIVEQFTKCQGEPVDLGGYYMFDAKKATEAMNPSSTLEEILNNIKV